MSQRIERSTAAEPETSLTDADERMREWLLRFLDDDLE